MKTSPKQSQILQFAEKDYKVAILAMLTYKMENKVESR